MSKNNKINLLFIDCTATYFSGLNTGIQRTVKKIIENNELFVSFDNVYSVVQFGNNYYLIDLEDNSTFKFTKLLHKLGANIRNFLDYFFTKKQIYTVENITYKKTDVNTGVKDNNFPNKYIKIIYFFRIILNKLFKLTQKIDSLFMKNKKVIFNNGDVLFIPDSFWDSSFSVNLIKKIKKQGLIKIILFVHDIFPITHPELVDVNNVKQFKKVLHEMIEITDGYVCNSNFSLSTLNEFIRKKSPKYEVKPRAYVHLGMDIAKKTSESNQKFINNQYNPLIKKGNFYLMVGTIEPKKNHLYVLNVFNKLWKSGYDCNLVIVGRIGWKCKKIIQSILGSPYYNEILFMINNASDYNLENLYRQCKAVIVASIVEGYGLPLVEAINFNKPVFASDIPIFREVGENYPIFFDINNIDSLYNKILLFEKNLVSCGERPHIPTWKECVKNLNNILYKMSEKQQ